MTLRNNKKVYKKKSAKNVNRGGGNLMTNNTIEQNNNEQKETIGENEKQKNETPKEELLISTVITQEMIDKYQYPSEYKGYNVAIRPTDGGVGRPFTIFEMCKLSWSAKEKPDWDAIRLLNTDQSDPLSAEVTSSFDMVNGQFKKDAERDIRPILNQVNVVEKAREANDKTIYTTFDSLLDSNNVTSKVEQFEIKLLVNQFPLSFSSDVITTILQKTIDNVVETSSVEPFPYIKDYISSHKNADKPYVPTVQVYPPQLVLKDSSQWGWQDNFKSMEQIENMDEKKITINTDNDNVIINESFYQGFMILMPPVAWDDSKNKYSNFPFLPIAIVELFLYCNFNDDKAFIIWKEPTYINPIQIDTPKVDIEPQTQPIMQQEQQEQQQEKQQEKQQQEEESKEDDKIKIKVDENGNNNGNNNDNINITTSDEILPSNNGNKSNDISEPNTENIIERQLEEEQGQDQRQEQGQEQGNEPSPNSEETPMEETIGKLGVGTLVAGAFAATAMLTLMTLGMVGGARKTRKTLHSKNIKQNTKQNTKQRKTIKLKKYNNKRNTHRVKYQKVMKPKTKIATKKMKI